ncbi:deoxyribodipyrimidine photo-lyase [soil metagenome]
MATVVWFRRDLRLADHAALAAAVDRDKAVVPVFVWDPDAAGQWTPGAAHRWWLHESLVVLGESLEALGSTLVIRSGETLSELQSLIESVGADALFFQNVYTPHARALSAGVRSALEDDGILVREFAGQLLHEPDAIRTGQGGPYQVFTPFWKAVRRLLEVPPALPAPAFKSEHAPATWPPGLSPDELLLTPRQQDGDDWAEEIAREWTPGEDEAHRRLDWFIDEALIDYADHRNIPDRDGTSRLSPHLHHGEISPRQIWHAVNGWVRNAAMRDAADVFLSEIGWREFAYHVLHHFPDTPTAPLKTKYEAFPWEDDAPGLDAWQRGATGFPIVDAGMRQLWRIGWMHNRVRMIVASFLTKDQLIPWQRGTEWFWDTLVDADLANNTLGWQWSAGCGADAQPFFRIFNPVSQGEKFDPHGRYVRHWCPELAALPDRWIHRPWEAPESILKSAGVELGVTYPRPVVDHSEARRRALEALDVMKGQEKNT